MKFVTILSFYLFYPNHIPNYEIELYFLCFVAIKFVSIGDISPRNKNKFILIKGFTDKKTTKLEKNESIWKYGYARC